MSYRARSFAISTCGSLCFKVSSRFWRIFPLPEIRIVDIHNYDPDSGSRIAPPIQVLAPNGSISLGWLCVSFLN